MILPLALIGLVSLPIIVAFYMLRLRRRDVPVGSTFLWQQLVRDVEANAPWQRLRFSWLLLLQLLIAALVVAGRGPAVRRDTLGPGRERRPHRRHQRLDGHRRAATRTAWRSPASARRTWSDGCPDGGRVTVVAAADTASVLVSETDDREAALRGDRRHRGDPAAPAT